MMRKRCKRCGITLKKENRSGFCRHCYILDYAQKMRRKRVENKCCARCGEKVKPKIVYAYRCEKCLSKGKKQENEE